MATGLTTGSLARCHWIPSASRDFTGAAADCPKYAPRVPRPWRDSQAKVSFGVVCKTVDVNLPWFESRTCHAKAQVSSMFARGPTPVREDAVLIAGHGR